MTQEQVNKLCLIGIDCGANGGIAIKTPNNDKSVVRMPQDIRDLRDILQHYADNYQTLVIVEKLSVRTDDIDLSAENKKAAMGKLFRIQKMIANFEHIKAIIEACGLPYVLVHSYSWQTKLGLRIKGEEKHARKLRYREIAQEHNPDIRVTLWNSDALLILEFGEFALCNQEKWVRAQLPEREQYKVFTD